MCGIGQSEGRQVLVSSGSHRLPQRLRIGAEFHQEIVAERASGILQDPPLILASFLLQRGSQRCFAALEKFVRLAPGQLEQIEKLEQLRVLENGFPIAIEVTTDATIGVDTPEDAKRFELLLEAK